MASLTSLFRSLDMPGPPGTVRSSPNPKPSRIPNPLCIGQGLTNGMQSSGDCEHEHQLLSLRTDGVRYLRIRRAARSCGAQGGGRAWPVSGLRRIHSHLSIAHTQNAVKSVLGTHEAAYDRCGNASGPYFAGAYPRLFAGSGSVQQHADRNGLRFLLLPRAMRSLMRELLYGNGSYPGNASYSARQNHNDSPPKDCLLPRGRSGTTV